MFSLIISIISVLLVVLLAIATIYYGGSSSQTAGAKASAAALVNQAVQIAGAGALTSVNGQAWPSGTGGIVFPTDVLTQMPTPPKTAYASGQTPTANDWTYYQTGAHHFVLKDKINKEVCLAVNRAQGVSGIPATLVPTAMVQCFGISAPYTFYYDPPGTTATQTNDAVKKSVDDANTAISGKPLPVYPGDNGTGTPTTVTTITSNGYPLHCASGRWIATGVCSGSEGLPPPGPTGGPSVTDCLAHPAYAGCVNVLPTNKSLQIRGWTTHRDSLQFVAAPDCTSLPEDTICLPEFVSRGTTWTWTGYEWPRFNWEADSEGEEVSGVVKQRSSSGTQNGFTIDDEHGHVYTISSTGVSYRERDYQLSWTNIYTFNATDTDTGWLACSEVESKLKAYEWDPRPDWQMVQPCSRIRRVNVPYIEEGAHYTIDGVEVPDYGSYYLVEGIASAYQKSSDFGNFGRVNGSLTGVRDAYVSGGVSYPAVGYQPLGNAALYGPLPASDDVTIGTRSYPVELKRTAEVALGRVRGSEGLFWVTAPLQSRSFRMPW